MGESGIVHTEVEIPSMANVLPEVRGESSLEKRNISHKESSIVFQVRIWGRTRWELAITWKETHFE